MFFIAPMSKEIVEATYALKKAGYDMGFCASTSHIGPQPYTGLTYDKWADFREQMIAWYGVDIYLERDHLGRNGESFDEWIPRDQAAGFNGFMLHVFEPSKALDVVSRYDSVWQIGPGEDDSQFIDPMLWERLRPHARWFSHPTGLLIQGLSNRGQCRLPSLSPFRMHNCDYLPVEKLNAFCGQWDYNIAPQIGVIQSTIYAQIALREGLYIMDWLNAAWHNDAQARRWNLAPFERTIGLGHYHFDRIAWRNDYYGEVVELLMKAIKRLYVHA